MEKTIVHVVIRGVMFELDYLNIGLTNLSDPKHKIPLSEGHTTDRFYEFMLNKKTLQMEKEWPISALLETDTIMHAKLPQLTELDAIGMADFYGVHLLDVLGKSDREFLNRLPAIRKMQLSEIKYENNMDLVNRRIQGEKPTVDVRGVKFIVDWEDQKLKHPLHSTIYFEIDKMDKVGQGDHFFQLFNHQTLMPHNEEVNPEIINQLSWLVIPGWQVLDPIALARSRGWDDYALLARYPIQGDLKASIIPALEPFGLRLKSDLNDIAHSPPSKKQSNDETKENQRKGRSRKRKP